MILPTVKFKLATVLVMRRECTEVVIFHTTHGLRGEVVMEVKVVVSETVVLHTTPGLGK